MNNCEHDFFMHVPRCETKHCKHCGLVMVRTGYGIEEKTQTMWHLWQEAGDELEATA